MFCEDGTTGTDSASSASSKGSIDRPYNSDRLIHIWKSKMDYQLRKGLFFKFRNFIGKVCLQSRLFDGCDNMHPARQESRIMKLICAAPTFEGTNAGKVALMSKHQRFLPILVCHKTLPVTSPILYPLPLRSFTTTIHPQCDIVVVPRYKTTLYKLRESNTLDLDNYRSIIFRILYTMSILQKKYGFMHNDQHIQNILMKPTPEKSRNKVRRYTVNGVVHHLPDLDWIPILWDFEDARCDRIIGLNHNAKTNNAPDTPPQWCPYYDAHFLLMSLIDVFADCNTGIIPSELRDWVLQMYPQHAIPSRVLDDERSRDAIIQRRAMRAQFESRRLIEQLLTGQSLPQSLHDQLHSYMEETWIVQSETDDGNNNSDDEDDIDLDDDSEYETLHYREGDNYYDYLKSNLPRDGITWDAEVHQLGILARQDMTMTEPCYILENRLSNTFPERTSLPTVDQLLASEFFACYRY